MNKKTILAILFVIGFLVSTYIPVTVADTIEDLGTFDYERSMTVFIEAPAMVKLEYVSSELFEEAITVDIIQFYDFYGVTNMTQIKFTSNEIQIDWEFKATEKEFIYQDTNSTKLYRIKVDFSYMEVPINPWHEAYINLSKTWEDFCIYTNETYLELFDLYTDAKSELKNTTEKMEQYQSLYNEATNELENLSNSDSETENTLKNMSGLIAAWENRYNELETTNQKMQDDLDSAPITIAIFVFGTIIIMFVIFHFYQKSRPTQSALTEDALHMNMDGGAKELGALPGQEEDIFKGDEGMEEKEEKEEVEEKITDETIINLEEKTDEMPSESKEQKIIKNEGNLFADIDVRLEKLKDSGNKDTDEIKKKIDERTEEITEAISQSEESIISHVDKLEKIKK